VAVCLPSCNATKEDLGESVTFSRLSNSTVKGVMRLDSSQISLSRKFASTHFNPDPFERFLCGEDVAALLPFVVS
jgi:hypothetical protein